MATEGHSINTSRAANRYRVADVDSEHRIRTKLAIELASVGATAYETVEAALEALTPDEPSVIVLGPSQANDSGLATVQRISRERPTCGVILLVEELSLDILQHALRSGVRDVAAINGGETALRQAVERVGDVVGALTSHATQPGVGTAPRGRVIVAFSTKGGVGKSMMA